MTVTFEDRVRGCLAGVAIGDALGMPVEIMTHEEIMSATGGAGVTTYIDPLQTKIKGTRRLPAGSTTDDTQLTLAVARSLIRRGCFDPHDQANELAKELALTTFGWGKTTQNSAKELQCWFASKGKEGRHPEAQASAPASPGASCGNGVAMKVAPLAIVRPCGIAQAMEPFLSNVMELGLQTHGDPRASFAAAAVGTAISAVLADRRSSDKDDALRYVKERVECAVAVLEERYKFFRRNDDTLSARLGRAWENLRSSQALREAAGTSCFSLESVPFSIGVFLRHPDDFRAGVLEAVNAGGDTDSNASMVGAMIGANVGIGGVPKDLLDGLRSGPLILEFADALADAARSPGRGLALKYERLLH